LAFFLFLLLVLLVLGLLLIRGGHTGLESDLDLLVTNLLGKNHLDASVTLAELKSALVEEGFNILELSVVLILVLNFLFKGLAEFGGTTAYSLERAEEASLVGTEGHDGGLASTNGRRGDSFKGEHIIQL
jgi:hypothetical protein